ncbi:MAG: response regulator [Deltaproteobacteria bacterium]|nr:response regulator [Deltaproteobacteria bacterium]
MHRELAENVFVIEADQGQIEQALLNLYVNAADAMPGGGDLTLKTMNTTHDDMKDTVYDARPGRFVLLTVTDTGTGMDKEIRERIFEPFFTTKEMGGGTGLGLASVYGVIKGHDGHIHVDSEQGRGTTFSIYLPASDKKLETGVKPAEQIARGSGTVLIVDDEPIVLDVGAEMLEQMGFTTLKAMGGEEALSIYQKNKDTIDLVILDMVMPDMGGGEVYDRIKTINPGAKVLLSSGYSIDGQAKSILDRGCDGFLQKPFTLQQLSEKTKELLDG